MNDELPAGGAATVAGISLPAGRRLTPESSSHPVLWATDEFDGAAAAWLVLSGRLSGTPLVPVLLSDLDGQPGRPWETGELYPCARGAVDALDPVTVLGELWDGAVPAGEEYAAKTAALLAPFSRAFPGVAEVGGPPLTDEDLAATVAALPRPGRLGLVLADRPADVPAVVGWDGAVNYVGTPAPLSAVLRSWEDRFGARLLRLGFDTIDLLVARPVAGQEQALAVAAEHFGFCGDNVHQGAGTLSRYAAGLPGAAIWSFWWD